MWGWPAFASPRPSRWSGAVTDPGSVVFGWSLCAIAFVSGVLGRDTHLTSQVRGAERRILAEFPTIAELLALAVAAGEGPVLALDRVVRRSGGELSGDLAGCSPRSAPASRSRPPSTGWPPRTGPAAGRPLRPGHRGRGRARHPLADVLHAQAADVREAGRRELIETAARKEVLMMVPVVFLVLPVTVLFAFWPGVVGLSLTAPTPEENGDPMCRHPDAPPATACGARRRRSARRDERGDVPGWVMITVMTAGIWSSDRRRSPRPALRSW